MRRKAEYEICKRCNGEGYLHQYAHIMHGQCFKCGGAGRRYIGDTVVNFDGERAYGPVQEFEKKTVLIDPFETMLAEFEEKQKETKK